MSAPSTDVSSTPAVSAASSEAADAAVEAIENAAGQEVTFSLELTQDQKDIRDWVHGFAADVVRPAGHEWDEKEQTPWPIIQEAAKIGLYGFEGLAQFFADPTGLTLPIVNEELFWGDAGIGMSIMGTALAVAAIFGQGSGEQIGEWIPRCFGTQDDVKVGAFCASEPNAGSDVSGLRTRAKFDEAAGEWVINGQKAWATNGGIADVHVVIATVDPELGSKGHAAFIVPMSEASGISQGSKVSKHGLRASHTADVFLDDCRVPAGSVLGGKERLDERLARAREGKRTQLAGGDARRSSSPVRRSARRRSASPAPPTSTPWTTPRSAAVRPPIIENQAIAFTLARDGDWRSTPPACSSGGPPGWPARPASTTPKARWQAQGRRGRRPGDRRAIQILGGNGYTRDYPVERWHRDAKIYTIFEGTARSSGS